MQFWHYNIITLGEQARDGLYMANLSSADKRLKPLCINAFTESVAKLFLQK